MKKKVIVITGASSGIGRETALLLNDHNFTVYAGARHIDKMKDFKSLGIKTFKLDVTNEQSAKKFINKIILNEKKIDILINNAGYGLFGSVEDIPMNEVKKQFEVNTFGLGRMTQLVLPYMRRQKSGKIINISSIGGKIVFPFGGWYHATKFAVEALSDDLRMQVKRFGIDVIVIEPGGIKTSWDTIARQNLLKFSKGIYKTLAKQVSQSLNRTYKNASSPKLVAQTILKSIEAKSPKPRYAVGSKAKMSLFASKLPDNLRDWIILKWMGITK